MSPVTIRPARAGDAAAIQRVARTAWHAAYDDLIGPEAVDETVDSWYDPERLVTDDVRDPDRPFVVAERAAGGATEDAGNERAATVDAGEASADEGGLVGFAEAAAGEGPGVWHLYRVYVHPNVWGEGVGTGLLQRIEAAVRQRDADELRVTVLADNEVGVTFYESRGFERLAITEDERFEVPRVEYVKAL